MLDPAESVPILLDACASSDAKTGTYLIIYYCIASYTFLISVIPSVSDILANMSPLVNIDTIRDSNLQSPLHLACKRKDNFENSTAIATLLIERGCDVNNAICDNDGMLPLHNGRLVHVSFSAALCNYDLQRFPHSCFIGKCGLCNNAPCKGLVQATIVDCSTGKYPI
jgi:hypothetical protein